LRHSIVVGFGRRLLYGIRGVRQREAISPPPRRWS